MLKKFRTKIGANAKLRIAYLEIPARVVTAFREKSGGKLSVRLVCVVNGKLRFQGGLVALGGGRGYVTLAKARMKRLGVAVGDTVTLEVSSDRSKFGMEYPVELRALLAQDGEAKRRFGKLPEGKQRYIVYYVGRVKSTHLRLERAIFLLENLKRARTENPSFREILGKGPRTD
jgi:hypothetical protein